MSEFGVVVGDGPEGPSLIGDILPCVGGAEGAIDDALVLIGLNHGVEQFFECAGMGAIVGGREQEGSALVGGGGSGLAVEDIEEDLGGAPAGFDLVDVGMGSVGGHDGGEI